MRELTEGWAAGLYLATLAIRDRASAHEFIEAFAGDDRHIVDYLSSEVLAGLPDEMRRFLLQTSVLERLCAPLCDVVTDRRGSERVLRELERSNFFLIPLDTRREWYSYHHLFRELLRHEHAFAEPGARSHAPSPGERMAPRARRPVRGDPSRHCGRRLRRCLRADPSLLDRVSERRSPRDLARLARRPPARDRLGGLSAVPGESIDACKRWAGSPRRISGSTRPREGAADGSLQAGPASVASGVAASQAINQYFLGDVGGIAETARPALEREEAGSDYWRSALLTTFGVSVFLGGDGQTASALLDEAVTASERSRHSLALIHALGWCAVVHAEIGEASARRSGSGRYGCAAAKGARAGELLRHVHGARRSGRAAPEAGQAGRGRRGADPRDGAWLGEATPSSTSRTACSRTPGSRAASESATPRPTCCGKLVRWPGRAPTRECLPELVARAERRLRLQPRRAVRTPYEEDLSARELAVLRLLATELNQREIGQALFVSFNTVKTHVKSIYRKLDVATRPDAVLRARELKLM